MLIHTRPYFESFEAEPFRYREASVDLLRESSPPSI